MKNNVVVRNELDEEFFLDVASPEVIRTIIAIEMEDRGHSRKEAKRVLTEVFSLSSEDAEFAIECYLYADET